MRASFVERHELGAGYARFRLHPVMRDYVRRKAGAEVMAAHEQAMARYFTALADRGGRQLGDTGTAPAAVRMAQLEQANLLAAQETALAQEMWDEAVSLAYRLDDLCERSGDWAARRRALEAGLKAARQGGKRRDEAGLAHNLGVLAQDTGEYGEARRLYGESLEIAQQLGDRAGVAITLAQLALLEEAEGNISRALELIRQAEAIFAALGSPYAVTRSGWKGRGVTLPIPAPALPFPLPLGEGRGGSGRS